MGTTYPQACIYSLILAVFLLLAFCTREPYLEPELAQEEGQASALAAKRLSQLPAAFRRAVQEQGESSTFGSPDWSGLWLHDSLAFSAPLRVRSLPEGWQALLICTFDEAELHSAVVVRPIPPEGAYPEYGFRLSGQLYYRIVHVPGRSARWFSPVQPVSYRQLFAHSSAQRARTKRTSGWKTSATAAATSGAVFWRVQAARRPTRLVYPCPSTFTRRATSAALTPSSRLMAGGLAAAVGELLRQALNPKNPKSPTTPVARQPLWQEMQVFRR